MKDRLNNINITAKELRAICKEYEYNEQEHLMLDEGEDERPYLIKKAMIAQMRTIALKQTYSGLNDPKSYKNSITANNKLNKQNRIIIINNTIIFV